ncbi:MAG: gfo/Idh/MocA family oxidoreductase [Calditrichaeota bacterium]|nr:MAG: gfo/Idh/MocA family oxidoreductase [Calditrichota bacterium]
MSEAKVPIGVVGVGHLGYHHVAQLLQVPCARLVGFYDIDRSRAAQVSREFSVPAFPSFQALLKACQAVSIVTPTSTHFQLARAALEGGCHVFVEKPITSTVEQADRLIELARQSGLKLQVGHIERFNPAIMALEGLPINPLFVESHRLGSFTHRGTDVAVVLDLMIHDIDLILSFVKSPVREVHASGISILSATEDIANCRLLFENGCVANVTASRISTRKMRKMRFFQPSMYISVDFLKGQSEVYFLERPGQETPVLAETLQVKSMPWGESASRLQYARVGQARINPLRHELTRFCQAILNREEPPITGEEARRALEVADRILKQMQEHARFVRRHWRF